MNSVDADLKKSVDATIAGADPSSFERLAARSEDLASSDYSRLRDQLAKFEELYKGDGARGFYAMKIDGSEIRFFVDSAMVDDPWHSEPGVVYKNPPPTLADVFKDGKNRFLGPYTDEYGSFYSFFSPVKNNNGNIVAVMGVDVESANFTRTMYLRHLLPIGLIVTSIILYFFFLSVINRRFEAAVLVKEKENLEEKVHSKTKELDTYVESLKKKTLELENFNGLMVGRELKMAELKKENEELKKKLDEK